MAIKNRLQTMDRIQQWNSSVNGECVLCHEEQETCQHLFFRCRYSSRVRKELVGGILEGEYTTEWLEILSIISHSRRCSTETFLVCYAFQVLAHSIWRERNARKHGEQSMDEKTLSKLVDKMIRLKFLLVKGMGKSCLDGGLMKWFATRISVV